MGTYLFLLRIDLCGNIEYNQFYKFKGGENMKIWLSKDEYRLPLMVEAKILVGSVKAILDRSASKYGDFTE